MNFTSAQHLCLQEMAATFGRSLDASLDIFLQALAQRSGEVSTAGRETFLATVADATISCLIQNLSFAKVRLLNQNLHPLQQSCAQTPSLLYF